MDTLQLDVKHVLNVVVGHEVGNAKIAARAKCHEGENT
jgi:hypothetical protein